MSWRVVLYGAGLSMITFSAFGKMFIYGYRFIKSGSFAKHYVNHQVGQMYKGGFEKTMTPHEAALILNVS